MIKQISFRATCPGKHLRARQRGAVTARAAMQTAWESTRAFPSSQKHSSKEGWRSRTEGTTTQTWPALDAPSLRSFCRWRSGPVLPPALLRTLRSSCEVFSRWPALQPSDLVLGLDSEPLCLLALPLKEKVLTPVSIPSLYRNSRIYSPGGGTDGWIFPLCSSRGRWQGRLQSAVLSLAETSGVAEGMEEAEGAGKGAEPLPQHPHAATRTICSCSPLQAQDQHVAESFSPCF